MPTPINRAFGGTTWQPDAMDTTDRYNADYRQRLNEMALGALGSTANYRLGMAGLQNQRDMFQGGLMANAQALGSQERMHSQDLGFAGQGLKFQSDALKQQLDLERNRDTTQQGNYQQMLQMGQPMRDISLQEMKQRAALEQLQFEQEQQKTKNQTAAQNAVQPITFQNDFERSDYNADIASGLTPAGATMDVQNKRRMKASAAADILKQGLGSRVKRLAERDSNFFFDKPTDSEESGIEQSYQELVRKFQESGLDPAAATAAAKEAVTSNAPTTFFRPHVRQLYTTLGLR